jgi:hypothetical protein
MPRSLNRALQARTADRLRADLARDEASGLPILATLSEVDQRELCDVGGGRIAAVAICVDGEPALAVRELARLVEGHVRRTDLVGWLTAKTVLVLAPGLDALAGRALAARLQGVLLDQRVRIGSACRSAASPAGWAVSALGAEAAFQARVPLAVPTVV